MEEPVTTNSQNHLGSMLHVQAETALAGGDSESFGDSGALTGFDEAASRALRNLTVSGNHLAQALEARLDALQESFMALLNGQLAEARLTFEDRLHLYLSPEGRLVVEGSDADAEKLCEVISRKPILERRFQELARMALLSHGVEVARQAHNALQEPEKLVENPLFSRYHMCLKGTLSHFYVR